MRTCSQSPFPPLHSSISSHALTMPPDSSVRFVAFIAFDEASRVNESDDLWAEWRCNV